MTEQKFNSLTAIRPTARNKHKQMMWLFLCDCGNEKELVFSQVKGGWVRSCGCLVSKPETRSKLSASLKAKYASGSRKKNGPETYAKSSKSLKKAHAEGRMHVITRDAALKGLAARNHENIVAANRKIAQAKVGVPNPPGPSAASPEHWKALYWELVAPNQEIIEGLNLNDLIRKNAHLFKPDDVVWKNHTCRASKGIRNLFELRPDGELKNHSWKGWRIGDKMKREPRQRQSDISSPPLPSV